MKITLPNNINYFRRCGVHNRLVCTINMVLRKGSKIDIIYPIVLSTHGIGEYETVACMVNGEKYYIIINATGFADKIRRRSKLTLVKQ